MDRLDREQTSPDVPPARSRKNNSTGKHRRINDLNKYSRTITQDPTQPAAQAMFYGIGRDRAYSLDEISEILGVGKERIRQIKYKGLKSLQSKVQRHGLYFSLN